MENQEKIFSGNFPHQLIKSVGGEGRFNRKDPESSYSQPTFKPHSSESYVTCYN